MQVLLNCRSRLNHQNAPKIEFCVHFHIATIGRSNKTKVVTLYPYGNLNIGVLFIYGDDYKLQFGPPSISRIISNYWYIPAFFMLTTVLLYSVRSKVRNGKVDISSLILDMITIIFGGGRLTYHHKSERYFSIVLMVGIFFLQSIWIGDFLSQMSKRTSNRVKTFDKLSKLGTKVYFEYAIGGDELLIAESLKYVITDTDTHQRTKCIDSIDLLLTVGKNWGRM